MREIKAVVVDAYLAESEQKKTPSIKIVCEPLSEQERGLVGEKVYTDLWLSDAALEKTLARFEEVFGSRITDFAAACETVKGKQVGLSMEEEEYNGKLYWKVKFINNPTRERRQADPDLLAKLNARLRSLGIANVATSVPTAPAADELPF
jgi:hypothetical protein